MSPTRNYRIGGTNILNRSCSFDARLELILLGDPSQNPFSTVSDKSGQRAAQGLNRYAAIDPKRTFGSPQFANCYMVSGMIAESTITCPKCGYQAFETMPTNACQFFYNCKGCGERLKPLPGDCCVFCSYGSVPCPPIQQNQHCCS